MMSDLSPKAANGRLLNVRYKHHCVRHAVFNECTVSVPFARKTFCANWRSFGSVKFTVTRSFSNAAPDHASSCFKLTSPGGWVRRRTNLAKQRAPLPHISAVPPSLLKNFHANQPCRKRTVSAEKGRPPQSAVAIAQAGDCFRVSWRRLSGRL